MALYVATILAPIKSQCKFPGGNLRYIAREGPANCPIAKFLIDRKCNYLIQFLLAAFLATFFGAINARTASTIADPKLAEHCAASIDGAVVHFVDVQLIKLS